MRLLLLSTALLLTACGPGLVFNMTPEMTKEQMLARADHIFIGVIEKQEFENWLFLQAPGAKRGDWTILKRQVRVETVLRGQESRRPVTIYEFFPATGGMTGDWNATHEGERDLFLVRVENGRYHLVRDFLRSIFPIYSGRHDRLPFDDNFPLWERIGLLSWWIGEGHSLGRLFRRDPGNALGLWRTAKIARGLIRYPERDVRVLGCETLLQMDRWQDECWDRAAPPDRADLTPPRQRGQGWEPVAMRGWDDAVSINDLDMMRLLTTVNRPTVRREFCRLFTQRYPNDHDNGCPADQPPPATIVTQDGDVPLIGPWPTGKDRQ